MPIRRREIVEKYVRLQGMISLAMGGVVGFALASFNNIWIGTTLLVLGVAGLNYSFIKIIRQADQRLDALEQIRYHKEM